MIFHPYGESAMLINLKQEIAEDINAKVIALYHAIQAAAIPGIQFYIPAYCSLTIGYDTQCIDYDTLRQKIIRLSKERKKDTSYETKREIITIPVCYDDVFALDMDEVMQQTGLSKKTIIQRHTSVIFRVYMLGFLPGFAYLGRLPETLHCNRKTTPRINVPSRSVGLAGFQTGIYPSEGPGGWQIIGCTPLHMFDGKKEHPFLLHVGDRVQFKSISLISFQNIENDIASGRFNLR